MIENAERKENRRHRRFDVTRPLTYRSFSSVHTPSVGATTANCSERGLCLRSPLPLHNGQYLCIRAEPMHAAPPADTHSSVVLKNHALAQVRWCTDDSSTGAPAYTIGIEYL